MLSMFKEHGIVFVGYYTAMYAASFGVAYAALTASGVDGVALCKKVGVNAIVDTKNWSSALVNAAIALVIADAVEIIRLPLVLATTPRLSRFIKRMRR